MSQLMIVVTVGSALNGAYNYAISFILATALLMNPSQSDAETKGGFVEGSGPYQSSGQGGPDLPSGKGINDKGREGR